MLSEFVRFGVLGAEFISYDNGFTNPPEGAILWQPFRNPPCLRARTLKADINRVGEDPGPPVIHHPERHFDAVDAGSVHNMS